MSVQCLDLKQKTGVDLLVSIYLLRFVVSFAFFVWGYGISKRQILQVISYVDCLGVTTYSFRQSVVDTLQELCADWRKAAAEQDGERLHTIVNTWSGMEITPAEFRRIVRLGHVTMPASIERMGDTSLNTKLDKV